MFFIQNERWIIPYTIKQAYHTIIQVLHDVIIPQFKSQDHLIWKNSTNGILTFKDEFQCYSSHPKSSMIPRSLTLWWWSLNGTGWLSYFTFNPTRFSFSYELMHVVIIDHTLVVHQPFFYTHTMYETTSVNISKLPFIFLYCY